MPAPAPAPDIRGRFLWYELMTTDPAKATEFYAKAVGWGSTAWPGQTETPYTLLTLGEKPVAGAMALPEPLRASGVPSHWLCYVGTPDVDATVARAKDLGATVQKPPFDVPDVGRLAVLKDPQGAGFAVYRPASAPDPESEPVVGQVSWHELLTTDESAAFPFYQTLFGWEDMESMDMGPLGVYRMYGRGGHMYGGMFNKTPDMPAPPNWGIYIQVEDVTAAVPGITAAGAQLLNGPMEVPGGDMIANFLDPQGAAFSVHSKKK